MGSSPRVRGTLLALCGLLVGSGIIPACAGNTASPSRPRTPRGDHPRVCGEHEISRTNSGVWTGSSPRVRGTQQARRDGRRDRGIIPACAGNTSSSGSQASGTRDHPRVCGEHDARVLATDRIAGSSPRVRGTQAIMRLLGFGRGIIPACAGNTALCRSQRAARRDHPRVCGEHLLIIFGSLEFTGSSPRVRGTRLELARVFRQRGIIPACAGNTSSACRRPRGTWDHPRMCGEHCAWLVSVNAWSGSSPRVRGTRQLT